MDTGELEESSNEAFPFYDESINESINLSFPQSNDLISKPEKGLNSIR